MLHRYLKKCREPFLFVVIIICVWAYRFHGWNMVGSKSQLYYMKKKGGGCLWKGGGGGGDAVAQSVERATPGKRVLGFDPRCGHPLPTVWVGVSIM